MRCRADKRGRIARETLDIYAPIAHRLGLNQTYRELQELSFEHLTPGATRCWPRRCKRARGTGATSSSGCSATWKGLRRRQDQGAGLGPREDLYSIYRKMREKHLSFAQVSDIFGFRIVVPTLMDCYLALGVLHQLYKPVPGRFKDYIAIPKANGYQSLHTTLVSPLGTAVEFQIRTEAMHAVAERAWPRTGCTRPGDKGEARRAERSAWAHLAAVADRHPGRDARRGRVPGARQDRPVPRRGLRVHAQEPDPGAAARRHAGGLRLRHPLRRGRPLRGGQGQRRPVAAAHRTAQRRRGRDHHRARRAPNPAWLASCAPAARAPRSATT
jgi:hypothetical protein